MSALASSSQLRASFIRWSLFLVPGVVLLGALSGTAGGGANTPWFASLVKPSLFPPPATFGIVWTILYVLMGFALALVVTARGAPGRSAAIIVFVLQLALNLAWTPLFFGAHQITGALALLAAIDLAVLLTVMLFWRVRPLAGTLLLPYLAWVLFATLLNWQFLEANPNADGQEVSGAVTAVEFE
ncbi:MAG: tryptophan-rich sensory protein [Sphingomonadaceae bacterium]|nr:tryptophan-rich sensory protein [Sphingomonadaceae bacterium]